MKKTNIKLPEWIHVAETTGRPWAFNLFQAFGWLGHGAENIIIISFI